MLVLSRNIGQSLRIGDDIEVTVLDINRGQVRLGIDAPRSTNIVREELLYNTDQDQVAQRPHSDAPMRSRHYLQRNRQR